MVSIRNIFFIIAGLLVAVGLLGWLGLRIQPEPFPSFPEHTQSSETVPLPAGLPAPVDRFYHTVYGEEIPVIETVVIQGRGNLKPFMNIPVPARFVFVHTAGKDYRHYFEATIFGVPLLKVNEGYIDGASFFESPIASYSDDPYSNQAANLTLWSEAIWFPAVWLTDPRAHWAPVDENTALLYVPYGEGEENFLVRFNPQTGLIDMMETMRYRDTGDDQPKILWILRNEIEQPADHSRVSSVGSAMWLDQGSPWAYFAVEELVLNVDVSTYIIQRGH
ncbi:MAG: hypothetical protein GX601_17810 [Anaerolineales bacterium]|nr:hypothetical protein [Anaerolineales bacterium]